jgi:hypothetical protein
MELAQDNPQTRLVSLVARNMLDDIASELHQTLGPALVEDPNFVCAFFAQQRLLVRLELVVSCAADDRPATLLRAHLLSEHHSDATPEGSWV